MSDARGTVERMWAEGRSGKAIAAAVGWTKDKVYHYAERHRDACPRRFVKTSSDERRGIIDMYLEGRDVSEIALQFGVSNETVYKRTRHIRDGRPPDDPMCAMAETIERMWAEGCSGDEIGEAVGMSRGGVYQYTYRHRDKCPSRVPRVPDDKREGIRKAMRDGVGVRETARRFGVCTDTVRKVAGGN